MRYPKIIIFSLLVFSVFSAHSFASTVGSLYEQAIPTSYDNPPTITLEGKTLITTSEILSIVALTTYCSSCEPFYHWQSSEGDFGPQ